MQFYLAPLEGITTYIFRRVYHQHFAGFDRYFTPFLASSHLSAKEKKEILPENNAGLTLIPQILANRVDTFLEIERQIADYGYSTVNLNLGCPSGTVVAKKRGAGQLRDVDALHQFLEEIFSESSLRISIKTRLGISSEEEWPVLLNIFKEYPLEELIIHARLLEDYYKAPTRPHLLAPLFDGSLSLPFPICYNGDIMSTNSFEDITSRLPSLSCVMLGRGIIANPKLLTELRGASSEAPDIDCVHANIPSSNTESLLHFLTDLRFSYQEAYGPGQDTNVLYKLKDIWNFLGKSFPNQARELKEIRKAERLADYDRAVHAILSSAHA